MWTRNTPYSLKFLSLNAPDAPKSALSQQWKVTRSHFVTGILWPQPCATGGVFHKGQQAGLWWCRMSPEKHLIWICQETKLPSFVCQHFICLSLHLPALTPETPAKVLWEQMRGQHVWGSRAPWGAEGKTALCGRRLGCSPHCFSELRNETWLHRSNKGKSYKQDATHN